MLDEEMVACPILAAAVKNEYSLTGIPPDRSSRFKDWGCVKGSSLLHTQKLSGSRLELVSLYSKRASGDGEAEK